MVVGGLRVVSISSLFHRINALFDKDEQFRHVCIAQLNLLQDTYKKEFNDLLEGKELNEESAKAFLTDLYDKALKVEAEKDETIFVPENKFKRRLSLGGDLVLASGFGASFFLLFGQKGFDAVKIGARLIEPSYIAAIDNLSYVAKLFIVFMTGIASGAMGFVCGLETRAHEMKIYRHLQKHSEDTWKAIALLCACGLSATSITAAALSITDKPNLFDLETWNASGLSFILFNTLLFVAFDFNAASERVILKANEEVTPLEKFTDWIEKNKVSVKELRQHGYFARSQSITTEPSSFPSPRRLVSV